MLIEGFDQLECTYPLSNVTNEVYFLFTLLKLIFEHTIKIRQRVMTAPVIPAAISDTIKYQSTIQMMKRYV